MENSAKLKKIILFFGDIAALYGSLALVILIRYRGDFFVYRLLTHLLPFSFIFAGWLLILYLNDLYKINSIRNKKDIAGRLIPSVLIGFVLSAIAFYLFGNFFKLTPKTNLIIFSIIFLITDYFWRSWFLKILSKERAAIAVFGVSPLLKKTINHLENNPQVGYDLRLHLQSIAKTSQNELRQKIIREKIKIAVIEPTLVKNQNSLHALYGLLPLDIQFINFWRFYETIFEKVPLEEVSEEWFVENIYNYRPLYDKIKRASEIALGVILSLLFSPLAAIASLLIAVTSKRPVIYSQKRIGKNGKPFLLFKFRTMRNGSKGPLWTEADDSRITAVGKLLRLSHLDELPQLINIIKGDISFTGPRPERSELAEKYQKIPYYEIRHTIKPGLTGWAQINFRPSASPEEAYEKLCYDMYYIKNRSLALDLIIILKTIKYLFASQIK